MKQKLNTLFRVMGFIFRNAPISACLSVLYYVADALYPAVTAMILIHIFHGVEQMLMGASSSELFGALLGYLLCFLVLNALLIISSVAINAGVYERINHCYRIKLGEKAASLPLIALEDAKILDSYQRASSCIDHEFQSSLFMTTVVTLCSILSVISVITVLAKYSAYFVLISLCSVLPYLIIKMVRGREFYRMRRFQAKKDRAAEYFWTKFFDIKAVREMRALNYGNYVKSTWKEIKTDVVEEEYRFKCREAKSLLWCDCIRIVGYVASIFFTLYLTYKGVVAVSVIAACIAAFQSVQNKTMEFFSSSGSLGMQLEFSTDFARFMDIADQSDSTKITKKIDDIEFTNVSFSYPGRFDNALTDVSFKINRGEKVVIVGENGSGKTTLLKLMLGMYSPDNGTVSYNNNDVQLLSKNSLYSFISMIPQSFTQFKLSVKDNVLLGFTNSSEDRLKDTLIRCGVPESLYDNPDLLLGKDFDGAEISGGEWQRLALARGCVRDSDIIILDEPTATLDPVAEYNILQDVFTLAENKTLILITHRIGLCRQADKVIVLRDGKISGIGTHDDLVEQNSDYANLYMAQSKWYQ